MLTHIIRKCIFGRAVGKNDIACQCGTKKISFGKIVAENTFFREKAVTDSKKNIDIQNPFSAIDTFVKKSLIEIVTGKCIRIQSCRTACDFGKSSSRSRKQGWDHTGLNHGMTFRDTTFLRIKIRFVFGMQDRSKQIPDSPHIKIRIGIQRNQIAGIMKKRILVKKRTDTGRFSS